MKSPIVFTQRLVVRRWMRDDREVFAELNADAGVMRYRFKPLTRRESDDLLDSIESCFDQYGFGQWAVERSVDQRVIGFIGFDVSDDTALLSPPVHIGWHLAPDVWGYGYATEGATGALDYVFDTVGLPEVVAHTTSANKRSQAVMRRLGMTHNPDDDFDGPWYPPSHPYRRFVLYRITASNWRSRTTT